MKVAEHLDGNRLTQMILQKDEEAPQVMAICLHRIGSEGPFARDMVEEGTENLHETGVSWRRVKGVFSRRPLPTARNLLRHDMGSEVEPCEAKASRMNHARDAFGRGD